MILMADEVVVEAKRGRSGRRRPTGRSRRKRAPRAKAVAAATETVEQSQPGGSRTMLFNKYSYDVEVRDLSLKNYVNLRPIAYPMTYRRGSQKSFSKANLNVVERLANSLMRGGTGGKVGGHVIRTKGRLQGKKITDDQDNREGVRLCQQDNGQEPAPGPGPGAREQRPHRGHDPCHIRRDKVQRRGRHKRQQENGHRAKEPRHVGYNRRIRQQEDPSDALANELVLASNMDINSYAIKRKNEIERMARSAK